MQRRHAPLLRQAWLPASPRALRRWRWSLRSSVRSNPSYSRQPGHGAHRAKGRTSFLIAWAIWSTS
eukprot:1724941-Pyramimonas_sp.AAC.1